MPDLILILLLLAIGWIWSSNLAAREIALHSVKAYCQKMNLQLLDGYVALTGLWPKRNANGKLQAWRSYSFEFSATGTERYNGKIIFLGHRIESIHLDPYREINDEDSHHLH
jgi:hypothetical protein